ncbi:hypothetical protein ACIOKD_36160 [Streptomyces sp. NPDC087844]|uniref:hypothetical protein n=1 Tax=Streptomyces sp. NPDC087844 TaxID=3365805 RepID=UPI00380C9148
MPQHRFRLSMAVVAGAAVALFGAAVVPAQARDTVRTSTSTTSSTSPPSSERVASSGRILQPHSNVRSGPGRSYRIVASTGSEWGSGVAKCYTRGEYVSSGGHGTNEWYLLNVDFGGVQYYGVWAWAGNVVAGGGLPHC